MYKMETKRHTESVLEKLMGFESHQPNKQQLRRGQQRVLSEKYHENIVSICRREKWSFNGSSMDTDTEMLDDNDSDEEGIQSSSSSYEIEADKLFYKIVLLNSAQNANTDYAKPLKSSYLEGGKPTMSFHVRRRGTCLEKRERRVACRGVAKQVVNELQQSVWHDSSKEFRCISTRDCGECGFKNLNGFPGDMSTCIVNRNCLKKKFIVHKDWCLSLVNGDGSNCNNVEEVDSKSEEDLFEDCLSAPLSPVKNSDYSDIESETNKAMERVLEELPDMLEEIDNFRNRESNKFDARQKVADDFFMLIDESQLQAVQESYLVDMLAELGHHPLEDLASLRVFDSLEKKYGKDPSWLRSERRLLFDRIKCGLSDILSPPMAMSISTRYNPLTKRHLLNWDQEVLKEELLNLLVDQENIAKRNSSQLMVETNRNWLDLSEDTRIVAKEIEEALISELLEEIL